MQKSGKEGVEKVSSEFIFLVVIQMMIILR